MDNKSLALHRKALQPEDLTESDPNDVPENLETPPKDLLITNFDSNLPQTCRLLQGPNMSKVYLLGTTHFSVESHNDVSTVIRNVRPHIVMVELCQSRAGILELDEATLEREAKDITFGKMQLYVQEHGLLYGILYTLFVNMTAKLTAQLGMAPGGEFRRALTEVKQIPGTLLHFGDRPIQITMKRALYVLSWWKRIRLFCHLVVSPPTISLEEVEKCKDKDVLDQILEEMSKRFPELELVFVNERDIYMTHSLQLAAMTQFRDESTNIMEATRVVGIVGIGHLRGISKLWGTVDEKQIPPIMTVPPPSKICKIAKVTIKSTILGFMIWGLFKIIPVSKIISNKL